VAIGAVLDRDAKHFTGLGQSLTTIAAITQGYSFKTASGKLMQHQDDTLAVMPLAAETLIVSGKPYLSTARS
jgi:hypothetical protein